MMTREEAVGKLYDIAETFFIEKVRACDYFEEDYTPWINIGYMFNELIRDHNLEPLYNGPYTTIRLRDPGEEEDNPSSQSGSLYIRLEFRRINNPDNDKSLDKVVEVDLSDLYGYYAYSDVPTILSKELKYYRAAAATKSGGNIDLEETVNEALRFRTGSCGYGGNREYITRFPGETELAVVPMKMVLGDIYDTILTLEGGPQAMENFITRFDDRAVPIYGFVHDESHGFDLNELDDRIFFDPAERDEEYWRMYGEKFGKEFSFYNTFFVKWVFK